MENFMSDEERRKLKANLAQVRSCVLSRAAPWTRHARVIVGWRVKGATLICWSILETRLSLVSMGPHLVKKTTGTISATATRDLITCIRYVLEIV